MQSKSLRFSLFLAILLPVTFSVAASAAGQSQKPTTRELNLLCWQEFQELVPEVIETVLLPVGSLEPHGVIPNGTDNLAPEAMARDIAERVGALVAPTLNYGITPAMAAYPGAVTISEAAYSSFLRDILHGLADTGFKNIIVLNGHGGNTAAIQNLVNAVSNEKKVRILMVNWWTLTLDITEEIFGENGGHAGNNETAYMQAILPEYVHPERYSADMAMPTSTAWSAAPVPYSISLYEPGQGYPTFDEKQAVEFFRRVNARVAELINEVTERWDKAGLYRE